MNLDITYRGPLENCNYDCGYCPFAKKVDSSATRARDKASLERFYHWLNNRQGKDRFRVLFTPWGEALTRSWYRETLHKLSFVEHVEKVVIQTNLSTATEWLKQVNKEKLALWVTFHPGEVTLERFINKTQQLDKLGIRYSVGIVGTKENMPYAKQLREQLNSSTYLWVNAYKDQPDYYQPQDYHFFKQIDPYFELNLTNYPSRNHSCRAGVRAISMDGEGNIQPCHFVKQPLGNVYQQDLHQLLQSQYFCPNSHCDCYIGYIHLERLNMERVYGSEILERITNYRKPLNLEALGLDSEPKYPELP